MRAAAPRQALRASGQSSHDRPPRMASSGRGGEGRNEGRMGEGGPGSRQAAAARDRPSSPPNGRPRWRSMPRVAWSSTVLNGVRVWPAGTPSAPSPPVFHELPLMARASFHPPRIARTPDGRIMAMLRGSSSVYLLAQPRARSPDPGRASGARRRRCRHAAPAANRRARAGGRRRHRTGPLPHHPDRSGRRPHLPGRLTRPAPHLGHRRLAGQCRSPRRKVAPGLLPDEAMISGLALPARWRRAGRPRPLRDGDAARHCPPHGDRVDQSGGRRVRQRLPLPGLLARRTNPGGRRSRARSPSTP